MRWTELEERQPRLAELARRRLIDPGVLLVVTIRSDGTPRLSPVEPYLMEGDLWLSMLWGSRKARDLLGDPRVLLHSIVTSRDGAEGELKLRGRVVVEDGVEIQERYAAEVSQHLGWSPTPGRFHLFRIDVEHVAFLRYVDATGDQYVASWPPPTEYMRPGDSATSLGEAVPVAEVLRPSDQPT